MSDFGDFFIREYQEMCTFLIVDYHFIYMSQLCRPLQMTTEHKEGGMSSNISY